MKTLATVKAVSRRSQHKPDFSRVTPIGVLGVKGLKSLETRNGIAFNYGLTLDGVAAAIVEDDGNGGEMDIRWSDPATEKKITAYAESLPPMTDYGFTAPYTVDLMLAELADAADAAGCGR